MRSEKMCGDRFPENGEIRCRKDKDHSGNHEAKAKVVDKNKDASSWNDVVWQWDGKRVVEQPKPQSCDDYDQYDVYGPYLFTIRSADTRF